MVDPTSLTYLALGLGLRILRRSRQVDEGKARRGAEKYVDRLISDGKLPERDRSYAIGRMLKGVIEDG